MTVFRYPVHHYVSRAFACFLGGCLPFLLGAPRHVAWWAIPLAGGLGFGISLVIEWIVMR